MLVWYLTVLLCYLWFDWTGQAQLKSDAIALDIDPGSLSDALPTPKQKLGRLFDGSAPDSPIWRRVAKLVFDRFDSEARGSWSMNDFNAHQKATAAPGEPAECFDSALEMQTTFEQLGFETVLGDTGTNKGTIRVPFTSIWGLYGLHGM